MSETEQWHMVRCTHCGQTFKTGENGNGPVCPHCGSEQDKTEKTCPTCNGKGTVAAS